MDDDSVGKDADNVEALEIREHDIIITIANIIFVTVINVKLNFDNQQSKYFLIFCQNTLNFNCQLILL